MIHLLRIAFIFLLMVLLSCSSDNKIVEVVSGNVIRLSSGDEIHLINVANSRNNYDYLCNNLLWREVLVVEKSREIVSYVNVIHATVYTTSSESVNDMLEKETPLSSPPPEEPRGIKPTDIVIPETNVFDVNISYSEWSKSNIKSTKDVSQIYTYIVDVFRRYDVDYMPHIPVIIISEEQMYKEAGDRSTVGLAYTSEYSDGEQVFEVHMKAGLTKLGFAEVLAHEIMHTWINQNNISFTNKADEEGLCNYASYIVLSSVGNSYAKSLINAMMQNPDPIYGEGFRNVKDKIETVGFDKYLMSLGFTTLMKGTNEVNDDKDAITILEMPIMNGSVKSQVISHLGYTISYNADYRIANWVAYELTATEARGTVPRSDAWAPNPSVNGPQADGDDYSGSGWDRGHLAPAGDMKWSSIVMDESFYYTNIIPQNQNLNGGYWRILEEKCRELAKRYGSIYIVCGGIVNENVYGTIGNNKITVPDAFFKVLLTLVQGTYSGIGFYFPNEAGQISLSHYARTIDEIEQMTNMDFFSALPDEFENVVEKGYNLRIWNM